MNSTTTPSGADLPKQMIGQFVSAIDEVTKQAARMLWNILINFLSEHWLVVLLVLFVMFIAVTFKAMMGRWGSLGSFLYNFFYFGTLFVVGLIWGPEVFVDDYFNAACAVILYPVCYMVVRNIMNKMGMRKLR